MDLLPGGSGFPSYGSEGGFGGILGSILGAAPGIINALQQFPGDPGDLSGFDLAGGDPATRTFFSTGNMRYTPQQFFVPDPTGKMHFFGPMGRPMLWSRDFAAARRLQRIARKAGGTRYARRRSTRRGGR